MRPSSPSWVTITFMMTGGPPLTSWEAHGSASWEAHGITSREVHGKHRVAEKDSRDKERLRPRMPWAKAARRGRSAEKPAVLALRDTGSDTHLMPLPAGSCCVRCGMTGASPTMCAPTRAAPRCADDRTRPGSHPQSPPSPPAGCLEGFWRSAVLMPGPAGCGSTLPFSQAPTHKRKGSSFQVAVVPACLRRA